MMRSNGRAALHMLSAHRRITCWARPGLPMRSPLTETSVGTGVEGLHHYQAMGCQIVSSDSYILAVKSNQGELNHNVNVFECSGVRGGVASRTGQQGHGRLQKVSDLDVPGGEWCKSQGCGCLTSDSIPGFRVEGFTEGNTESLGNREPHWVLDMAA